MPMIRRLSIALLALLLAGCDIPGLGPDPRIAQREADSKAIGAACRHAMRAIEECYEQNEKASKAAVFEGWKEMDQYMRDNKIEGIAPRQAKADGPVEEIMEDKKAEAKASTDVKGKADVALKSAKPADKAAGKATSP
jgi:hypothetical protein